VSLARFFSAGPETRKREAQDVGERTPTLAADPHPRTQRITHLLPQTAAAAKRLFPAPPLSFVAFIYKGLGKR